MARVSIINQALKPVDRSLVERIVELLVLPAGNIDIHFHNAQLPADEHAYCISSRLHRFVPDYKCLCRDLRDNWDCCIFLSERAGLYQHSFPAFFAYLLAHELCHAKICLTDLSLHVLCCLIREFIGEASNNAFQSSHLVPDETTCDAFGLHVALTINSRERVKHDFECLIKSPEHKDQERLHDIIRMTPSDRIVSLRHDIIAFALPYKPQLIKLWKQDYATHKDESLASLVMDQEYEPLFNPA